MADQTIDYDALARQAGAISSAPPSAGVDYEKLAKQFGAISSQPSPSQGTQSNPPAPPGYAPPADLPPAGGKPRAFTREEDLMFPGFASGENIGAVAGHLLTGNTEGPAQMGRGIQNLTTGDEGGRARAASDVIRGGMTTAAPYAAPAMVTNPIRSLVGLGVGAGTQAGIESGAQRLGVPPGPAALAGDVAGIAAGGLAAKKSGRLQTGLYDKVFPEHDPHVLLTQAIKPRAANLDFTSKLDKSLPEVKASEQALGKPIENIDDLLAAVKDAKQRVWGQIENILGPQRARGVDLSPLADAMDSSIPPQTRIEDPGGAAALMQRANVYRARTFTIQEAEDLLQGLNGELNGYFAKYPRFRWSDLKSNPETAATVSKAEALRTAIYNNLDAAGEGAAPRELKSRYGSLLDLEQEAQRRKNVADRQQPSSLSQQAAGWYGTGRIITGLAKTATGNFGPGAMNIVEGLSERAVANWMKEQQTTNALIKRAFAGYDQTPTPVQYNPIRPLALLPSGAPRNAPGGGFPSGPDTSFVHSVPAMPQPPNPRRALPAGPPRIFPMGASPDTSYVGKEQAPPQYQKVLPSAKGAPIPSGGFATGSEAVQDLVPVKHPVTGQIEYVPRWTQQKATREESTIPPAMMATGGVVAQAKPEQPAHAGGSVEDKVRGSADIPISSDGVKEADNLGRALAMRGFGRRGDLIIPSALQCAQQTANLIYRHTPLARMTRPTKNLDTWSTGLEGMPTEQANQIIKWMIQNPDSLAPQATGMSGVPPETFNQFRLRFLGRGFKPIIDEYKRNPFRRILPVIHGRGVRLLKGWVDRGMPDDLSVNTDDMLKEDDQPGEAWRLAPASKSGGKWRMNPISTDRTSRIKMGIIPVRHASTPWNKPQAPRGLMKSGAHQ